MKMLSHVTACLQPAEERPQFSARFALTEAVGSLGDLGTFVPIVVGMTQIVGLNVGTVLVFAGLANIFTGLVFRVPIAVQPMKAIAALAIIGTMDPTQVAVAGLVVGLIMLAAGLMGLTSWLNRAIPRPIVYGLQMAVAWKLLTGGLRMAIYSHGGGVFRPVWGTNGLLIAAAAAAIVLLLYRRSHWMAIGLVVLGLAGACVSNPSLLSSTSVTLWKPGFVLFDYSALQGVWLGGLPQVPLTLLNSVLAVSVLAGQLFPANREATTPRRIAVSVGLMNILSCPFGGMPICHGSGGLAGQYRFGARSGLSVVLLGTVKLIVGLLLGAAAFAWMQAFPSSVLGVFLMVAGVSLAEASGFWQNKEVLVVGLVMVVVCAATGTLVVGFASGWITYVIISKTRKSRRSEENEERQDGTESHFT